MPEQSGAAVNCKSGWVRGARGSCSTGFAPNQRLLEHCIPTSRAVASNALPCSSNGVPSNDDSRVVVFECICQVHMYLCSSHHATSVRAESEPTCSSQIRHTSMTLGELDVEQGEERSSAAWPVLASELLSCLFNRKGLHTGKWTFHGVSAFCSHAASCVLADLGVPGCIFSSTTSSP